MATSINKKINTIFKLLEKLANGEELYAKDENLQLALLNSISEASEKSLRRYLEDIYKLYPHIIIVEKVKKEFQDRSVTIYRVKNKKDISNVLKFFIEEKNNDFTWVLQLLHEQDPLLINNLEDDIRRSLQNELQKDKDIFLFSSNPFETFSKEEDQKFNELKYAVQLFEYRTIVHSDMKYENAKCLKIIYSQNNWYVAIETQEEELKILRIKFIQKILPSFKVNYKKNIQQKYQQYFLSFQNPFSLYNTKKETAKLKALPEIAKYFEKEMKPFFLSQKYIQTNSDKSVEFSIEYTQEMEVLPFIKRWLPSLIVLKPASLQKRVMTELNTVFSHYSNL